MNKERIKTIFPYFSLFIALCLLVSACTNPFMEKLLGARSSPASVEGPYTGPPGSGTLTDPFIVHNPYTLRKVGSGIDGWELNSYYEQISDISLATEGPWTPIVPVVGLGLQPFTGQYDGKGKIIGGLKINDTTACQQGLFSQISSAGSPIPGGVVKNVNLVNCEITGMEFIGGIAGENDGGRIENCSFTGVINGEKYIGGITGNNYNGKIINCHVAGVVTGTIEIAGGVVEIGRAHV